MHPRQEKRLEFRQCAPTFAYLTPMTAVALLQLKQQLSKLTEKERQEVSAFLHRMKQETPAWQKETSRRMAEMDTGKKIRLPRTAARA